MNKSYDPKVIEPKWQKYWGKNKLFSAKDGGDKPKYYCLIEFPYPSAEGLHVGHPRSYTALDIVARKRRMEGYNVLFPIGWDAFGLPAENYAIKTGIHPRIKTEANIVNFRRQLKSLGFSFDWDREISTADPKYYKWTQWIFLQLFKHGLAYKAKMAINFCLDCKVGLANEEVVGGKCERCGGEVVKKTKSQWLLKITKYADKLEKDLDDLDYIDRIKVQQKNWIGRSEGATIQFKVVIASEAKQSHKTKNNILKSDEIASAPMASFNDIIVYTTRPDTLFGATYMVLAPEHELVQKLKDKITNFSEVSKYIDLAAKKSDLERTELQKEKTGVELKGVRAVNPVNSKEIAIWISDYVLASYGTGAIMAVPAHDDRDFEFAHKFGLEIIEVISGGDISKSAYTDIDNGKMVNSDFLNGLAPSEAISKMTSWLAEKGIGSKAINYKLRDWIFSRQRYWGEPIPLVHCKSCQKEILDTSTTLNCYDQETWNRLADGSKTVESRALNPEEPDRYFGNIKVGGTLKLANKVTGEEKYFEVKNVWSYKNSAQLFADKEVLKKIYAPKSIPESLKELESGYSYTPDYIERINKNGVIAWELQMITPGIVPWEKLPLELPEIKEFQTSEDGESPLSKLTDWVNVKCPKCGGPAKRETDTMPQWAGSSWYFLRYIDPANSKDLASPDKLKYWLPVDWYNGGMEHTTLHLLYSRFWHKFLYDIGVVPTPEPYQKRTAHGMILGEGGEKMSKSRGNVVNPDDVIGEHGADTLRLYEMFMGPFDQAIPWDTKGVIGVKRFLDRIWNIYNSDLVKPEAEADKDLDVLVNKTIQKVAEDIEAMRFNTAVSALMILSNQIIEKKSADKASLEKLLILLSPFAPHIAEELWENMGHKSSLVLEPWPQADKSKLKNETIELIVQINGKVRAKIKLPADVKEAEALKAAQADENVQKYLTGQTLKKTVFVPGKLISFVV
ncbi:MAG: leucine--tRNA ligase [Candidatus Buchananbacteria bacterium]|nr:leucine--tRNA ligase [Candidatus Buchananbacteria bacterium]